MALKNVFKISDLPEMLKTDISENDLLLVSDSLDSETSSLILSKKLKLSTLSSQFADSILSNVDSNLSMIDSKIDNISSNLSENISNLSVNDKNLSDSIDIKIKLGLLNQDEIEFTNLSTLSINYISEDKLIEKLESGEEFLSDEVNVVYNDNYINAYYQQIKYVDTPTDKKDAVNKQYIDDKIEKINTQIEELNTQIGDINTFLEGIN